MKKLWDLAHEKLVNILGGHHVGTNIHGWQPYLKIAIYVLKSANGGLLCRPLYFITKNGLKFWQLCLNRSKSWEHYYGCFCRPLVFLIHRWTLPSSAVQVRSLYSTLGAVIFHKTSCLVWVLKSKIFGRKSTTWGLTYYSAWGQSSMFKGAFQRAEQNL